MGSGSHHGTRIQPSAMDFLNNLRATVNLFEYRWKPYWRRLNDLISLCNKKPNIYIREHVVFI